MNRIVVDRQPLLLLVSSKSLLPMVVPAREVRALPDRLEALVEARLRRLGIDADAIAAERQAMQPVTIAATVDRSVLGIMVDFAHSIPYYARHGRRVSENLADVEDWLGETPCHAARPADQVIFPNAKAPELVRAKWGSGMVDRR